MSSDRLVHDLIAAHCEAESGPENDRWRVCFVPLLAEPNVARVKGTTNTPKLASISADTSISGNPIIVVTSTGATFITDGVEAGDEFRTAYTLNTAGESVYTPYVVDRIDAEDVLHLLAGPSVATITAQRFEIWHNNSKAEESAAVAAQAAAFGSKRVRAVWPATINEAGTVMEGYFLCAGLAGLASGVAPHQGLTRYPIQGFDAAPLTTPYFSPTNLDAMASSGVWIVEKNAAGVIQTRHALTTDMTDVDSREEMRTRNLDSMSFVFFARLEPFIGVTNVTPDALSYMKIEILSAIEVLKARNWTMVLGPQLIEGTIDSIAVGDAADHVEVHLSLVGPFPDNNIDLHLAI